MTIHFSKLWVSRQQNIHGMIILPGNPHQLIKSFLNNKQFISFIQYDCVSWLHLNASYVLGNEIAKLNKKLPFTDWGNPKFFNEVVQYWVAFELVQIFHKNGLKPMFKDNLEKWSNNLYCIVQLLKKIPQTEENNTPNYSGTFIKFRI